jgi:HAD superfamily hydrolase (TIGR01509 family)
MSAKKWVVFDLIGVLAEPSWRDLVPEESEYLERWNLLRMGLLTEHAFWTDRMQELYRELLAFRPARLELVRGLKRQGYEIAIATNFSSGWLEKLLASLSGADRNLFSRFVVSDQEGVAKPDQEFFARVKRFAPEGSVFVDDRLANCQAAERAGYRAIWAHPAVQLEREIAAA